MSGRTKIKDEPKGPQEQDGKPQTRSTNNAHFYNNKQASGKRSKSNLRQGNSGLSDRQPTPNGVVALQKEKGFLPTDPIGNKSRTTKNNKFPNSQLAPKFPQVGVRGKTQSPDKPTFAGKPPSHQATKFNNHQSPRQTGTVIDTLLQPKASNSKSKASSLDVFQQLFPNGKPNGIQSNSRHHSDHAIPSPVNVPVRTTKSTESIPRQKTVEKQENRGKEKQVKDGPVSSAPPKPTVSAKEGAGHNETRNQRRNRNKKLREKQALDKPKVKDDASQSGTAGKKEQKSVDIFGLVNKTTKLNMKETVSESSESGGKSMTEADKNEKPNPQKRDVKATVAAEQKVIQSEKQEPRQVKPVIVDDNLLKLGLYQAEAKLNKDYIVFLEKKSQQFPDAKFICKLCNYHMDTVIHAHRHIKEKRHRKLFKEKKQDELLRGISLPPTQAIKSLQKMLSESVLEGTVLTAEDVKLRKSVVQKLDDLISKQMAGTAVVLYGSSLSGFGFKTSDVNVDLQYPSTIRAPNALLRVLDILERSEDTYKDVRADFRAKIPRIEFTDIASSLPIRLSTNNEFAVTTTRLLMFYAALDPRVLQLSMVFRTWAQLCKLDRQHEGSLPPYAFVLMAIFFMQKQNYLPVLHKVISDHDMDTILSMSMNCPQLVRKGDTLWYMPSPPTDVKKTSATVGRMNSDGTEDSDSESELDMTGTDGADSSVSPLPSPETFPAPQQEVQLKPISLLADCGGRGEGVALLWLKMIKFYALEYNIENLVISIKHAGDIKREDRNWGKKRVAVLDPYSTKRNLCRSMNTQNVFSFMMARLKAAVLYFHGSPRNRSTQVAATSVTSQSVEKCIKDLVAEVVREAEQEESQATEKNANTTSVEVKDGTEVTYEYKFTRDVITEGNNPVVVCGLCKKEGHVREKCPDEVHTHTLAPIPPMTSELRETLDRVSRAIMGQYMPTWDEVNHRQQICAGLTGYLHRHYDSRTIMTLFGSSKNGFGFRGSDLDICLTFDDNDDGQDLDFVTIIEDVAKCLRRCQELRSILPITTAKVPIVKFEHRMTGLEGDISLYNLLAQRNTLMLSCYANVDERCRVLGYVMKAFVKRCHIGDASRGSLSSYAYTLMVIFFLQQREPAVLPVLQQLDTDGERMKLVDGWNSWFFEDLEKLESVWSDKGKNTETVGELWLAMIRFYTEDFDFKKHVISIRQKKLLTTFEKEWTSKFISIEDPFDLNHNLGAGVSRKMTNFIMRVFIKARQHFSQMPEMRLSAPMREVNYFFDAHVLMDGEEAPNDRCCRICGKIGHFVRTCPKSRRRKKDGDDENDIMSDTKCFYCGEMGHIKKHCPALKEENLKGPPRRPINGESPNKMATRPIPINRNSPMGRSPQTPGRYENGRNPSYNHAGNHSPADKLGKASKRLGMDASPSTPIRDHNRNPRIRKNSSDSAAHNGQPSPSSGTRFDDVTDEGKPPTSYRHVPARAKLSNKWQHGPQLHIPAPQGGHSPRSMGADGPGGQQYRSMGPAGSPQGMAFLSQIESQLFQASPRDNDQKLQELMSNEKPSPRGHVVVPPANIVPITATPVLGLGVRTPNSGRQPPSPRGLFSPPIQPPQNFPPYPTPEMSPQTPPYPFYGCSPGGSPWSGQYFQHGGS